jgi:hypothetical protein
MRSRGFRRPGGGHYQRYQKPITKNRSQRYQETVTNLKNRQFSVSDFRHSGSRRSFHLEFKQELPFGLFHGRQNVHAYVSRIVVSVSGFKVSPTVRTGSRLHRKHWSASLWSSWPSSQRLPHQLESGRGSGSYMHFRGSVDNTIPSHFRQPAKTLHCYRMVLTGHVIRRLYSWRPSHPTLGSPQILQGCVYMFGVVNYQQV